MAFLAKFAASKYVGEQLEDRFAPEVCIYTFHILRRYSHPYLPLPPPRGHYSRPSTSGGPLKPCDQPTNLNQN